MKKIHILIYISLTTMLIHSACKKETKESRGDEPDIRYMPLMTGNYWVYQRFRIDTNGNETPTAIFDSCYIEKDTIIGGRIYYQYITPDDFNPSQQNKTYLRDSLHYLITNNRNILFSSQDHTTIFDHHYNIQGTDTLYELTFKMVDSVVTAHTPAGIFQALNSRKIYYLYPTFFPPGIHKIENTLYAPEIGIVSQTLHGTFSNPATTERRLIRYYLNQPLYTQ
jgi:hypothetical protein